MKKFLEILLTITSALCGFLLGGVSWISLNLVFYTLKDPTIEDGLRVFALVPIVGCVVAVIFAMISEGRFGSKSWKISRYIVTIAIPLAVSSLLLLNLI